LPWWLREFPGMEISGWEVPKLDSPCATEVDITLQQLQEEDLDKFFDS
jgi:hypothetical protein